MLPFLRAQVPRTQSAAQNPVEYEDGRSSQTFHGPQDEYLMTQVVPPTRQRSFLEPPTHFHTSQTERFRVQRGTANFYMPYQQTGPTVVGARGTAVVPERTFHRFENASDVQPLVLDIGLSPKDRQLEERFFRNFFGYLDDCRKAKVEPSIFQLLLFLDSVGAPLWISLPGPEWLSRWVAWLFTKLAGIVVGRLLLGYRATYPEYYKQAAQ